MARFTGVLSLMVAAFGLLVGSSVTAFAHGPGERVTCRSDDSKIQLSFYEPEWSETRSELALRMALNEKDTTFPAFSQLEVSASEDEGTLIERDRIRVTLVHRDKADLGTGIIDDIGLLEGAKGLDGRWEVSFTSVSSLFPKGPLDQDIPLACAPVDIDMSDSKVGDLGAGYQSGQSDGPSAEEL